MDIGGKRSNDHVTGAAESGVAKRRRIQEPSGAAEPLVHEHFRWADLPRDLFCHLAGMLLFPEYLKLRRVSGTLKTRVDEIGPVATASSVDVDLAKDWTCRIKREAIWCSTLKLTGPLTNIPQLAEGIAAGKWTTLDLFDADTFATLERQEELFTLLEQLEQRLPEGRGLSRRRLYLRVASQAVTNIDAHAGEALRFTPAKYVTPLVHVLTKLSAAGKLHLTKLILDGCSPDHQPLLRLGDLDVVILHEEPPPEPDPLGGGQGAPVPPVALALAALGNGGSVRRLRLEVSCDTGVEALVAYCRKKKVESLEVRFSSLGPDTITKLFALPLRLAHADALSPAPQEERALLEAFKKSDSLEVIRIDSLLLQWDWDFIQACKQKPRLKELRTRGFLFELGAGNGLGCTRLSVEPSQAAQALRSLKDDLGTLRDWQLSFERGWGRAEMPSCDWSALSSLERLQVRGLEVVVFPWGCLSSPRLATLDIYAGQGIDLAIRPGELLRQPLLKNLIMSGKCADFTEMLVLLRYCQKLEKVHLDCWFDNGRACATALVVIATLQLPALKYLAIRVRYEALRQHLLAKLDLKALRPSVEIKLLGEGHDEFAEPQDIAHAIDVINVYYAGKMAEKQQ